MSKTEGEKERRERGRDCLKRGRGGYKFKKQETNPNSECKYEYTVRKKLNKEIITLTKKKYKLVPIEC